MHCAVWLGNLRKTVRASPSKITELSMGNCLDFLMVFSCVLAIAHPIVPEKVLLHPLAVSFHVPTHELPEDLGGGFILSPAGLDEVLAKLPIHANAQPCILGNHRSEYIRWIHNCVSIFGGE